MTHIGDGLSGMTNTKDGDMEKRDELIKELKEYGLYKGAKAFWINADVPDPTEEEVEDIADFILARERKMLHDHEILTKTIVDTKNAEKAKMLEDIEKPLKDVNYKIEEWNSREDIPPLKECEMLHDAKDEALAIIEQAKKGQQ